MSAPENIRSETSSAVAIRRRHRRRRQLGRYRILRQRQIGEAGSVIKVGYAAENMSTLRRLALNLVKGEKSLKIGVAANRKRAGWDLEYLWAILRLAQ